MGGHTDANSASLPDANDYREYLKLLTRIRLGRRLQRRVDPSDIVQETLLRAHGAAGDFRGGSSGEYLAWLRQILARTIANTLRDHGREKRDAALERSLEAELAASSLRLGAILAADQTSPSGVAMRAEAAVGVARAISELAEIEREVLLLHHWESLPLTEIAAQLGIDRFAVARTLRQTLAKLRGQLGSLDPNVAEE